MYKITADTEAKTISIIKDNDTDVNIFFIVKASLNLVNISPTFLVVKNFIGNLYTCLKYPKSKGISIFCDKYKSICCLIADNPIWVIPNTKNPITKTVS